MNRFLLSLAFSIALSASSNAVIIFDGSGTTYDVSTGQSDWIRIIESATVNFNSGAIVTGTNPNDVTLRVADQGTANINDGSSFSNDVLGVDDAVINITGGTLNDDLISRGNALIIMSGGTVADDVEADEGTITISGGSVGEDIESTGGTINISGGTLFDNGLANLDSGIAVSDNGTISFTGTSFLINGVAFGGGSITDDSGTITGTLQDGSMFSSIPFSASDGGTININVVPEPSAFILSFVVASMAGLWRRRRPTQAPGPPAAA